MKVAGRPIELPYGRARVSLTVPDDAVVVQTTTGATLADGDGAVRSALADLGSGSRLADRVGPRDHVLVIFPDITRPMPNRVVLPPLLDELEHAGAGPDRVELLCATGTHRPATPSEMAELLGPSILERYRVGQHRADDGRHVSVGRVQGVPILLDARYVSSDVRICTGFVEPHFFAGFSGGPKGVCPGLAATETILEAHSPERIADPAATWCRTDGNPVHEFIRQATDLLPPDLSIDVTLGANRGLSGVFAGRLPDGHQRACEHVRRTAVTSVDTPFDVVVTTNGGYPLDRNLYQAVKGMAAAAQVVREGGTILLAAACADGMPNGSAFARTLAAAAGASELAATSGAPALDRWQVQVLGRVLGRARILLYSDGVRDLDARSAFLEPVSTLQGALEHAVAEHGTSARVCVLVDGPLSLAVGRSN
ncbi:MAG: nickel-dependent lactate racemase [Actinomycetota bacterium]|nr:nickel-dependent lactate racemase [Actinomycetota bacterium]